MSAVATDQTTGRIKKRGKASRDSEAADMIGITTEKGTLRIAAEISIPHGQNWSPGRIQRLMMDIERYVFAAELADKADNDSRKNSTLLNFSITGFDSQP